MLSTKRSFGSAFSFPTPTGVTWLGLALLALAWLVPNHYRPWSSFHSEAVAFVGTCLLVASCLLERRPKCALEIPWIGLAVLVLAFVPWVQLAAGVGQYAGDAVLVSLYLLATTGAIVVGYASRDSSYTASESTLSGLMCAIGVAAFISGAIGLLQWLSVDEYVVSFVFQGEMGGRAAGNLAQSNHLGTLLLMGMIAAGYGFERGVFGRVGFAAAIVFMSAMLILTQSRTGILSAVVVGIFALAKKNNFGSRLSARAIWGWMVLFLVASWLFPHFANALLLGGGRGALTYTYTSDRLQIWQQVVYAILQQPWLGYGWNQTSTASLVGALQYPGDLSYSYAHSVVLDLLAWNGLPLGLLIAAMCAVWLVTRFLRLTTRGGIYALAVLLPLVIHSLLEFPFAYAYFLLPAGFLIGHIEASLGERKVSVRRRFGWALLGVWAAVGWYLTYEYFLIEEDFRIVRFEGMRVGKTPADYEVPNVWLASHMASMLRAARQPAKPGLSAEELANLRMAAMRFPYGALTYRYALALGLNGDPEGARRWMATIRGMYGEKYYRGVKADLLEQAAEKYPQLAAVNPP